MKKLSRTISGVTPVAVMAKPAGCPSHCVYCPTFSEAPKSYTPESPAVLRAIKCNYDPELQVKERIQNLSAMGHPVDKIELIIMGGTFLAYPENYQYEFIKKCYDAMNQTSAPDLKTAKLLNETAKHRCVGLCIETRPDWCDEKLIKRMLEFGTTRVEIGVQTIDDNIYKLVKRGHTVEDVINATRILKYHGFKVYYHWMPNLPGSDVEHDYHLTQKIFEDKNFRPDGLKLYPTLVIKGTELEKWYNQGLYTPYTIEELSNLMLRIKSAVPKYVRISRVMRDIPTQFIEAGCRDLALRDSLKKLMAMHQINCNCIRCREYGHRIKQGWETGMPHLKRIEYEASYGKEIFLSYEDEKDTLFGLLRLRLNDYYYHAPYRAIVREIHVFGPEIPIGTQNLRGIQHTGIGTKLIREAERITREEFKLDKLAIISGVGAREYFRNEFGYTLESNYMVKILN